MTHLSLFFFFYYYYYYNSVLCSEFIDFTVIQSDADVRISHDNGAAESDRVVNTEEEQIWQQLVSHWHLVQNTWIIKRDSCFRERVPHKRRTSSWVVVVVVVCWINAHLFTGATSVVNLKPHLQFCSQTSAIQVAALQIINTVTKTTRHIPLCFWTDLLIST